MKKRYLRIDWKTGHNHIVETEYSNMIKIWNNQTRRGNRGDKGVIYYEFSRMPS